MPTQHRRFTDFDHSTKMLGALLVGWRGTIYEKEINQLLAKHDLTDIDPSGWYPVAKVLEFLTEIEEHYNVYDLIGIGKHIGTNFEIPEPYRDMEAYLMATDTFYQMPYQGKAPGSITPQKIADRHIRLTLHTPWPANYWYGTFYGLTHQLAGPNDKVALYLTVIDEVTCMLAINW
jgi:hypothetical protein